MKRVLLAAACAAALGVSVAPSQAADGGGGVTLHPNGFGEKSYSAWKAQEGEPDRVGAANHALYFQKETATATPAAGVAVFEGIDTLSLPAAGLELAFDRRLDGDCGGGAPRFNVTVEQNDDPTTRQTLFVGCQAMEKSDAADPRFERRSTQLPAVPGTVVGLAIVFDEGNDIGTGRTWLDNIQVNDMIWTGPADNSTN